METGNEDGLAACKNDGERAGGGQWRGEYSYDFLMAYDAEERRHLLAHEQKHVAIYRPNTRQCGRRGGGEIYLLAQRPDPP